MQPIIHKILIHGADVIKYTLLSIVELSKTKQQATSKFRDPVYFDFTRKENFLQKSKY